MLGCCNAATVSMLQLLVTYVQWLRSYYFKLHIYTYVWLINHSCNYPFTATVLKVYIWLNICKYVWKSYYLPCGRPSKGLLHQLSFINQLGCVVLVSVIVCLRGVRPKLLASAIVVYPRLLCQTITRCLSVLLTAMV